MKVKLNRDAIRRIVDLAIGAVDTRAIKPVLQDICFRCSDAGIEVSATDLDVGIKALAKEGIEVQKAGEIALLASEISSILHESPDDTLTMEVHGSKCHIHGQGSEYHITGENAEDFPGIPPAPDTGAFELPVEMLNEMIRKTRFSATGEATRYALNGVLFVGKREDKSVEMVGADGRRLAQIRRKATSAGPMDVRSILSLKFLAQIEKVLSSSSGAAKVMFGEGRAWVVVDDATVVGQLVEGHYPNYEEVIPDDCDKRAVVNCDALSSAVRRAAVVTTDESHSVILGFRTKLLIVSSESPERGSARIEVEAEYDGPDADMRFNPDYLLDMLKVADDEKIVFEFKEPARPALLRCGRNYLYLVMPITDASG